MIHVSREDDATLANSTGCGNAILFVSKSIEEEILTRIGTENDNSI